MPFTTSELYVIVLHHTTQALLSVTSSKGEGVPNCSLILDITSHFVLSPSSKRHDHAIAYDLLRERCIIFGGVMLETVTPLSDTWAYDGFDWTLIDCQQSPPPTLGARMIYDFHRDRMVMFGDFVYGNFSNQTWEFDGYNWTETTPDTNPYKRYYGTLAYDSIRKRVILFSGETNVLLNDTWEYRNSDTGPILPVPAIRSWSLFLVVLVISFFLFHRMLASIRNNGISP